MKRYIRIMLGKGSAFAKECYDGGFIGADFLENIDMSNYLFETFREFNEKFIPIWINTYNNNSKIAAGLACGALWTIIKGIKIGDIILSPDGKGNYYVGEVISDYSYHSNLTLPHRRSVKWNKNTLVRNDMTMPLQNSICANGTTCELTKYSDELDKLINGNVNQIIFTNDDSIEDPSVFALEKHLEDFLIANWSQTELGKYYDIFQEEGEIKGQQYPSDTGPIDILAVSKDKKTILVVELKKGRASDNVVGQIQRYMGYVKDELAEANQEVKGVIIALEDDLRIRRALSVTTNIEFYRYQISFKLIK